MNTRSLLGIIQLSARSCVRVAAVVFSSAVIIFGSRSAVYADHRIEAVASGGSYSEQLTSARQTSSENRKFAQFYLWPFDRPRQNFNMSPPSDERAAGESKRKALEQLRTAPPPPSLKG